MSPKSLVVSAGLLLIAGYAGFAQISGRGWLSEEEAFVREFPDALIYKGVGLYRTGDYGGAVGAWRQYLKIAPQGADTVSIKEMIAEADKAAGKR